MHNTLGPLNFYPLVIAAGNSFIFPFSKANWRPSIWFCDITGPDINLWCSPGRGHDDGLCFMRQDLVFKGQKIQTYYHRFTREICPWGAGLYSACKCITKWSSSCSLTYEIYCDVMSILQPQREVFYVLLSELCHQPTFICT